MNVRNRLRLFVATLAILSISLTASYAAETDAFRAASKPLLGRWDLKVTDGSQTYPSWLEINFSGHSTLVGSYVGQFGSARPISKIDFDPATKKFRFVVPRQWESRTNDIVVEGALEGEALTGHVPNDSGKPVPFQGRHAPRLLRESAPEFGQPIELFDGSDLSGWKPRHPNSKHGWRVQDGILINATPGNDIMTERQFTDFKLRAEFRYPKGANSGIYLRGRYEVQIEDNFSLNPDSHYIGGIYGFLTPRVNAAKQAGEWQTLEITLIGRIITIVLNGQPIIEHQAIPGITGGALDSDEEKPGPILIQGDHGQVEFKKLTLTPAE